MSYRMHSADEPLQTLLEPTRPDGWVAGDESYETQPLGVSCCRTLQELAKYARAYSMAIRPTDVLVELTGDTSDDDRDEYAERCTVDSYSVIGTGAQFAEAAEIWRDYIWDLDEGCVDWDDLDVAPEVRALTERIHRGE